MRNDEARAFLAQFARARQSFNRWPKWMRDGARYAVAAMPTNEKSAPAAEATGAKAA